MIEFCARNAVPLTDLVSTRHDSLIHAMPTRQLEPNKQAKKIQSR
jgi:hypothetical protein